MSRDASIQPRPFLLLGAAALFMASLLICLAIDMRTIDDDRPLQDLNHVLRPAADLSSLSNAPGRLIETLSRQAGECGGQS